MTTTIGTTWVATAVGVLLSIGVWAPRLDAQTTEPPSLRPLRPSGPPWDRGGIEGDPIPLVNQDPRFRDYLAGVAKQIRSKWLYPCVRNTMMGQCEPKRATVEVEFGILKSGVLRYVEVRQRAGDGLEIYDDHAVAAIKLAGPFPAMPPEVEAGLPPKSTGMPVVATFRYVPQHPTFPTLPSPPPVYLPRSSTGGAGVSSPWSTGPSSLIDFLADRRRS